MSPDLKLATIYVMPLGGADEPEVLAALDRHKKFLRGELAHNGQSQIRAGSSLSHRRHFRQRFAHRLSSEFRARETRSFASRRRRAEDRRLRMNQKKSNRAVVDGWVVLDKPVGVTSTQAVSRLKRIYNARKAGHAGTLDPLASGILPVAFGEATKTVPFVQDGEKSYHFTVSWGARPTPTLRWRDCGDQRGAPRAQRDRSAACAFHRRDCANPAALLGDQDRRRARL